jgi:uroporphyrinogen-III decarboxylase
MGHPNVVGYVLDAGEDLGAARRVLGAGPLLLGNLGGPDLAELRPAEIRVLCDQALAQRGPDQQVVLATCCADIPLDTPPECIEVLTDAVCRAGRTTA